MDNNAIEVDALAQDPTSAWKEISKSQRIYKIKVKLPTAPVDSNKVRFVCMSDTHSLLHYVKFDVPDGDVFIHAGDFTKCGHLKEVKEFNRWLGRLPHRYKIVIAGNHELSFDEKFTNLFRESYETSGRHAGGLYESSYGNTEEKLNAVQTVNIRQQLTNCIYLEDNSVTVYGIKIHGTPWQPEFGNWAFNIKRGEECLAKWNQIPVDTDILITHTPPLGHGDLVCSGVRAGCVDLLNTVQKRVQPKYHVFGHIHEGYGITSDGKIIFINASTCDINYIPNNLPIIFDMPLPDGQSKS